MPALAATAAASRAATALSGWLLAACACACWLLRQQPQGTVLQKRAAAVAPMEV